MFNFFKAFKNDKDLTVDDLFKEAWAHHWSRNRFKSSKWAEESKRIYKRNIKPFFGKKLASEVTAKLIREWHLGFEDTPYAGNRSLEVLSRIFTFAEEMEMRPQGTNPCKLVHSFPERSRNRYASEEEIKRIGQILIRESVANPSQVAFLYLLIFSGSRPSVIEKATWDQLQKLEHQGKTFGVLTFFGKSTHLTGDMEVIVIPPMVLEILETLPRFGDKIFNIKMPRKLWERVRREAGCPDLRMRDWRRTFATVGRSSGVDMDTIGQLLNHHSAQTTKRYAKLMDNSRIFASEAISGRLESLLQISG